MAKPTMAVQQEPIVITCPNPSVDHLERHGYLFGYPIAHSMSSLLHQTVFDRLGLKWGQMFLPSTDMDQFLALVQNPKLYGSAVTMPHKVAIIPHLDSLTEECRAVGACNTIFRRGTQLIGANTDTIGIRDALQKNVTSPDAAFHQNRPALVVGGGGAARSACYALVKLLGFQRVYLANRDASEVEAVITWCRTQGYGEGLEHVTSASVAESLPKPSVIVSCVPDIPPATAAEKEARRVLEVLLADPCPGASILEMAYHPAPWTQVAGLAAAAGWQVVLGTEAMIYQGLRQHVYWHGREVDAALVQEVKDVVGRELSKARL